MTLFQLVSKLVYNELDSNLLRYILNNDGTVDDGSISNNIVTKKKRRKVSSSDSVVSKLSVNSLMIKHKIANLQNLSDRIAANDESIPSKLKLWEIFFISCVDYM
jgi:predicted nucleic acid-binding protein